MNRKSIFVRKSSTLFIAVTVAVGGLFHSSCLEPEDVAPGDLKYCLIEVTNYYPKADGTTKNAESKFGNIKSDANGKCPPPNIVWKNQ
jgi:hypothetical protein